MSQLGQRVCVMAGKVLTSLNEVAHCLERPGRRLRWARAKYNRPYDLSLPVNISQIDFFVVMARKRKAFEDIFGREKPRPPPSPSTREVLPSASSASSVTPGIPPSIASQISCSPPSNARLRSRQGQRLVYQNFLQQNSSEIPAMNHSFNTSSNEVASTSAGVPDLGIRPNPESSTPQDSPSLRRPDYGLSVMAQVILNRDTLEFNPLGSADLDAVVDAAQATVRVQSSHLPIYPQSALQIDSSISRNSRNTEDRTLDGLFNDPRLRHRTVLDASMRIRSLRRDMQNHLIALQGLSLESALSTIQNVLSRAERAVQATSFDLTKEAKRDTVREVVSEAMVVLEDVRKLVITWRETHPDMTPLRIDNSMLFSILMPQPIYLFHRCSCL